MTTPIALDMPTILAAARVAFDAKSLQAQTSPRASICLYAGPCAIGVAIPEDLRANLDRSDLDYGAGTGIGILLTKGLVSFPSPEQAKDAEKLQNAHDNWTTCAIDSRPHYEADFTQTLVELEAKYDVGLA